MTQNSIQNLRHDRNAVTAVEFGILAPVMMVLMMGFCDLTYQIYAESILTGAVQQAGRNSGIEGGADNSATIDSQVIALVSPVVNNLSQSCTGSNDGTSTWCSKRKNYDSFSAVAPEPFTDANENGVRDTGECFTDINNNGTWDADPGLAGQGRASDVTAYTMAITYPRLFPLAGMIGLSSKVTISATTLLKNQPYAAQQTSVTPVVCT
ncbi:MAG: TadE family protein [Sphingomonadaceae bacterium]